MEKIVNLKVASTTHTGYIRERNEDSFFVSSDHHAFAVADGMGGMAAGDVASQLVVKAVESFWSSAPPDLNSPDDVQTWIAEAIDAANGDVVKESFNRGLDMGTTLVLAIAGANGLLSYGHLGDSRLYVAGKPVTTDHAIGAHELTNFAGRSLSSSPDLASIVCAPGTRVLLCTDGLNKVVTDEEISELMLNASGPEEILEILMDLALGYGGPDNITMICLDYI